MSPGHPPTPAPGAPPSGRSRAGPFQRRWCRLWAPNPRGHTETTEAELAPVSLGGTVGSSGPAAQGESCCANMELSSKASKSEKTEALRMFQIKETKESGHPPAALLLDPVLDVRGDVARALLSQSSNVSSLPRRTLRVWDGRPPRAHPKSLPENRQEVRPGEGWWVHALCICPVSLKLAPGRKVLKPVLFSEGLGVERAPRAGSCGEGQRPPGGWWLRSPGCRPAVSPQSPPAIPHPPSATSVQTLTSLFAFSCEAAASYGTEGQSVFLKRWEQGGPRTCGLSPFAPKP